MNLMFWKKKTDTGEEAAEEVAGRDQEATDPETTESGTRVKPGPVARIKLQFFALIRRFRETPAPDAGGEGEYPEEVSDNAPALFKKRLIIGGVIGLLVLLLAGIGMAIWTAFTPSQIPSEPGHDIVTATSRPGQPEHAPDQPQSAPAQSAPVPAQPESAPAQAASAPEKPLTEVEPPKKESPELQARTEAPDKEPPQQQVPPDRQTARKASSYYESGEMVVGIKEPKATAKSLKEAIEDMNAGSGDHDKKPAK